MKTSCNTTNPIEHDKTLQGKKAKINGFAIYEGAVESEVYQIVIMTGNSSFWYAGIGRIYEFVMESGNVFWLSGQCFLPIESSGKVTSL